MSSKNNVNPDHYKTAGRERQGESIVHDIYKRRYTQSRANLDTQRNFIPGAEEENVDEVTLKAGETRRKEDAENV